MEAPNEKKILTMILCNGNLSLGDEGKSDILYYSNKIFKKM
tara:strand:- start:105 stop:227 length:123 start_codon:yes stop_codon:yes gene_type:complete